MEEIINNKSNSYLTFKVGGESFAANVQSVLNIVEVGKITKVPQSPEYMLGVINLRGAILPVIDSRIKFSMPVTEITKHTFIVVMEVLIAENKIQLGLLVDSVSEVLEEDDTNLLPPPNVGDKFKTNFICNVISRNDEFVMVLDVDKVFATDELIEITKNLNQ